MADEGHLVGKTAASKAAAGAVLVRCMVGAGKLSRHWRTHHASWPRAARWPAAERRAVPDTCEFFALQDASQQQAGEVLRLKGGMHAAAAASLHAAAAAAPLHPTPRAQAAPPPTAQPVGMAESAGASPLSASAAADGQPNSAYLSPHMRTVAAAEQAGSGALPSALRGLVVEVRSAVEGVHGQMPGGGGCMPTVRPSRTCTNTPRSALLPAQEFAAVEAPLFGRVSSQLSAAREQARVAELKTGEAVQVRLVV